MEATKGEQSKGTETTRGIFDEDKTLWQRVATASNSTPPASFATPGYTTLVLLSKTVVSFSFKMAPTLRTRSKKQVDFYHDRI